MPINLETVAQARLNDPIATLNLMDQGVDGGDHLALDTPDVVSDDGAEQEATKARRRVGR